MSRPPSRPREHRRPHKGPRPPGKHPPRDPQKSVEHPPRGPRASGERRIDERRRDERPRDERSRGPRPEVQERPARTDADQPKRERRPDRRPPWQRRIESDDEGHILIWGIHAVEAALRNPQREVRRLLLTDNAAHRLAEVLQSRPLTPEAIGPRDLDRELGPDTVHQGALLETGPLPEPLLDDLIAAAPNPLLVVLDQVTDPHNVGAILRSAAAFGVCAVIMTRRHSPPSGGALAKSASGALELVPVLHVANLARTLAELGEKGVLRLGLDGEAEVALEDIVAPQAPPAGPIALVLGAEERGLRRLSRDHCDQLVRLMTPGALKSLNVSNAAAIAMHHIAVARRTA